MPGQKMLAVSGTLGAETITKQYGSDKLQFETDGRKWKLAPDQNNFGQNVAEYVLENETPQNPSELMTLNYFASVTGEGSARRFSDYVETTLKSQCPDMAWSILSEKTGDVFYHWSAPGCDVLWPRQTEIARVLEAPGGLFVLHYYAKTALPADKLKNWQALLEKAQVL